MRVLLQHRFMLVHSGLVSSYGRASLQTVRFVVNNTLEGLLDDRLCDGEGNMLLLANALAYMHDMIDKIITQHGCKMQPFALLAICKKDNIRKAIGYCKNDCFCLIG